MSSKGHHRVNRREFVGALAGLAASAALPGEAAEQREKTKAEFTGPLAKDKLPQTIKVSRPNGLNLIVLICDTFRWDHLGFNCQGQVKTPHLDALAEEGVYFANCYADGLPTIPARRVIHTGRSILPEQKKWVPLKPEDVTLAEILSKAGFTTGFIVDTYHHFKPDMNFHRGFSSWEWIRGQEGDPYRSGPRDAVRPEDHVPPHLLNDHYRKRVMQYLLNTKERKGEEDYFCAQSCAVAARWLRENKNNSGPFMLFVDMFDPHEPWDAPPRFQKMYRQEYPFERYIFGYGINRKDIREEDIPILRDLYAAEVSFSDYCIGKLFEEVKRLGLWDETIIVFSTDHGTHLGEQGCIQKQAKLLNSAVARVPLIIRHPDKRFRGKRMEELAGHLDFTPTFLSLLGVETNLSFDGGNLWELLDGRKLHDFVATGFDNFGAVHTRRWHYFQNIWGEDPGLGPQLYDLENDPLEEKNVAALHPEVVAEMKAILEKAFQTRLS